LNTILLTSDALKTIFITKFSEFRWIIALAMTQEVMKATLEVAESKELKPTYSTAFHLNDEYLFTPAPDVVIQEEDEDELEEWDEEEWGGDEWEEEWIEEDLEEEDWEEEDDWGGDDDWDNEEVEDEEMDWDEV